MRVPTRPWLCLFLLGCGAESSPEDPCRGASLTLSLERTERLAGSRSVNVRLEGSAPFEVSFLEIDEGSSASFDPATGLIAVEALPLNGDGPVLAATAESVGCRVRASTTIRLAPALDGWRHPEPITNGTAAAVSSPYFAERTEAIGLATSEGAGRAMVVDLDGDGREDLVTLPVTEAPLTPRVYRNLSVRGEARFEEWTPESGLGGATMTMLAFADLDQDGDQDAVSLAGFRAPEGEVGFWESIDGTLVFNGRSGIESPRINEQLFHEPAAATLADFDGDGLLDLYVGHWYAGSTDGSSLPTADVLYRNLGGRFDSVALPPQINPLTAQERPELPNPARAAYGLAAADFDDDGDLDLFVNNYGAGRPLAGSPPAYWDHNFLWRNDGNFSFVDIGAAKGVAATTRGIGGVETEAPLVLEGRTFPGPIGGNGFGCQWADIDNDNDLDLISATIAHPDYRQSDRTLLFVNQGPPDYAFVEQSFDLGLTYAEDELHPAFIDVDNDGFVDLSMSRLRNSKWRVYLQREGRFELQSVPASGVDIERPGPTLWLDADQDGDLDFFMAKGQLRYFENQVGSANRALQVELTGPDAQVIGARVRVRSSAGLQQRQVVGGEGHYNVQPSRTLHFGLGGDSGAESVRVQWLNGPSVDLGPVRSGVRIVVSPDGSVEAFELGT